FGKLVRHTVLAYGDLDLHARIVDIAQHLDDTTDRLAEARWLLDQFDTDYLCCFRLAGRAGQQDVLADALVFRRNDPDTIFVQQAADDVRVGTFDHFNDRSFRTAAPVGTDDAHLHTVAVQHLLHFLFRQE